MVARNTESAEVAKQELISNTGRNIFEIISMDMLDLESIRAGINVIDIPIDVLIMNAGGLGGQTPNEKTENGVTKLFASNVLGHVVLLETMLKANKITQISVFSSSEGARGIMGIPKPNLTTSSIAEFVSIIDGSYWGTSYNTRADYGLCKYIGTMWMASLSRKYPDIRFVSVSPGATANTNVFSDIPAYAFIVNNVLSRFGVFHSIETGAQRYIDVVYEDKYKSGSFYASEKWATGKIVDQVIHCSDLANKTFQDNAYKAIHHFL